MKNLHEYILSLRTKRVWWKPWTWRRKSPLVACWPLTDGDAQAVNPAIDIDIETRLAKLEFASSYIPPDWTGQRWVITDRDKFRRIIFVDHFTPESLAQLDFDGDPASIIIFPMD